MLVCIGLDVDKNSYSPLVIVVVVVIEIVVVAVGIYYGKKKNSLIFPVRLSRI